MFKKKYALSYRLKPFRQPVIAFCACIPVILSAHCQASSTKSHKDSDGKPILENSLAAARKLRDYTFDSELITYNKKKPQTKTAIMSYKQARLIRLQVTGSGSQAGSIVVRRADGVIRGRGGNGLSFLTMNLDPDSRMLMAPNGINVMNADLESLLADATTKAKKGQAKLVDAHSFQPKDLPEKVDVVELLAPGSSNQLLERVFVRTDNKLPAAWELYRDGKLFSRAKFSNLKTNQGLNDDLFKM
jgi:outer membrane lipoprotein-sorting protein